MDKYEYKVRADEIKELIASGEYVQAAEIADTIDWRRVKSVMMLCTISDLYKINRRYEDARNMLLLAYERRPGGRTICYSLCELCIKTEEFVQAVNYYKEFVQVAPKDPGRYILQYKLYEAQDVSLEERISVLEELKKRDYREKWAYELAYLYHRVGLATRCVEECDELILWFGEGKYVIKAMELKMLHQPLTAVQQEKYDHRFDPSVPVDQVPESDQSQEQEADYGEAGYEAELPYEAEQPYEAVGTENAIDYEARALQGDTLVYDPIRRAVQEQIPAPEPIGLDTGEQSEELDIQVKTMDMGKYNTINLQAELAAGLREVLGDEQSKSAAITRSIVAPMMDTETLDYPELEDEDIDENDVDEGVERIESTEVFFGETGELGIATADIQPEQTQQEILRELQEAAATVEERVVLPLQDPEQDLMSENDMEDLETETEVQMVLPGIQVGQESENSVSEETETVQAVSGESLAEAESEAVFRDETAEIVMNELRRESIGKAEEQALIAQPPKELAGVLSQESDGQISLVMPELETVEKQITGQMNIQDVLAEWERLKQESQERREEEVRQRVLQQTGNMFTEFEASVRDGLLEQLESGAVGDEYGEGAEDSVENLEIIAEDPADLEGADETAEYTGELQGEEDESAEYSGELQGAEDEPAEYTGELQGAEDEPAEYTGELQGEDDEPAEYTGELQGAEDEPAEYTGELQDEDDEPAVYIGELQGDMDELTEDAREIQSDVTAHADEEVESGGEDFKEVDVEPAVIAGVLGVPMAMVAASTIESDKEADISEDLGEVEELEEIREEEELQEETAQEEAAPQKTEELKEEETPQEPEEPQNGQMPQAEEKSQEAEASYEGGASPSEEQPEKSAAGPEMSQVKPQNTEQSKAVPPKSPDTQAKVNPAASDRDSRQPAVEREKAKVRALTQEEKELFAPYIQSKAAREQLVKAIDNISLAAYTGNIIISGDEGMDTTTLAKNMIREVQLTDSNFSGKVAKISGNALNGKNVAETLGQLKNGALIIQKASGIDQATAAALYKELQRESLGIIVVMVDTKKAIGKFLEKNQQLSACFTSRMNVEALSNDMLVAFGKQYAKGMEYTIDDLGVLALHTRIDELQTIDHAVTVLEVKQIVDDAIHHANKKTVGHFFDILLAKRYDEEDMIVLTEKDFA